MNNGNNPGLEQEEQERREQELREQQERAARDQLRQAPGTGDESDSPVIINRRS
jgi:hypothetical protein